MLAHQAVRTHTIRGVHSRFSVEIRVDYLLTICTYSNEYVAGLEFECKYRNDARKDVMKTLLSIVTSHFYYNYYNYLKIFLNGSLSR